MEQVAKIAYQQVLGLPVILWGGLFTLVCFLAAGVVGFLTIKGIKRYPMSYHTNLAYIALASGLFHGLMGLLSFL